MQKLLIHVPVLTEEASNRLLNGEAPFPLEDCRFELRDEPEPPIDDSELMREVDAQIRRLILGSGNE